MPRLYGVMPGHYIVMPGHYVVMPRLYGVMPRLVRGTYAGTAPQLVVSPAPKPKDQP